MGIGRAHAAQRRRHSVGSWAAAVRLPTNHEWNGLEHLQQGLRGRIKTCTSTRVARHRGSCHQRRPCPSGSMHERAGSPRKTVPAGPRAMHDPACLAQAGTLASRSKQPAAGAHYKDDAQGYTCLPPWRTARLGGASRWRPGPACWPVNKNSGHLPRNPPLAIPATPPALVAGLAAGGCVTPTLPHAIGRIRSFPTTLPAVRFVRLPSALYCSSILCSFGPWHGRDLVPARRRHL